MSQVVTSSTPAWIKYLVGAYPQAGLAELTPIVMQSHFADMSPEVMMAAVKAYVEVGTFWPTVAELRPHVAKAQAAAEEHVEPLDWRDMQAYKASSRYWQLCADGCGEYRHESWSVCPFCAELEVSGS